MGNPLLESFSAEDQGLWNKQIWETEGDYDWIIHSSFAPPCPTTTIWHPCMGKSAFVRAVESSTICQGAREESCPPTHWVIRHPDLSPSCGPCRSPWTNSGPSWPWSRSPWKKTVLNNHPWITEPLWKSRSPGEKFQNTNEAKNQFGLIRDGKKNSLTLLASPLSQGGKA